MQSQVFSADLLIPLTTKFNGNCSAIILSDFLHFRILQFEKFLSIFAARANCGIS